MDLVVKGQTGSKRDQIFTWKFLQVHVQFQAHLTCSTKPYTNYITDSQFSDKPCDASASVSQNCNCEFAAISCYISEMVQDIAIVTIEH